MSQLMQSDMLSILSQIQCDIHKSDEFDYLNVSTSSSGTSVLTIVSKLAFDYTLMA